MATLAYGRPIFGNGPLVCWEFPNGDTRMISRSQADQLVKKALSDSAKPQKKN